MFLAYWPVLAVVVSLVLVLVVLGLSFANKLCMARHKPLAERPLQSYLPQQEQDEHDDEALAMEYNQQVADMGHMGSSDVPQIHVDMHADGGDFEPGMQYRLDSSMSPEGRKEFGV